MRTLERCLNTFPFSALLLNLHHWRYSLPWSIIQTPVPLFVLIKHTCEAPGYRTFKCTGTRKTHARVDLTAAARGSSFTLDLPNRKWVPLATSLINYLCVRHCHGCQKVAPAGTALLAWSSSAVWYDPICRHPQVSCRKMAYVHSLFIKYSYA